AYRLTRDDDKYIEYIERARSYMSDHKDAELNAVIDEARALQQVRNYQPALYAELIRVGNIRDSIHEAEVDSRILELQEAYETEKRKQEIATQSLEIEAERRRNKTQLQIGLLLGALALSTIAALIFFVIYRRKRAALEKQKALQKERLRISKDLHDNVGAHLTGIALRSDLLGRKLDPSLRASPEFSRLTEEAGQTVEVLRDTIWAINQDQFTVADFAKRVETYSKRLLPEGINFKVNQEVQSDYTLQSLEALNLFRVVQEALQNTMKHADADSVEVKVKVDHSELIMSITDDGKGSDGGGDPEEAHYGLQNMQARMAEIGGTISFSSTDGRGFTVEVTLPKT
ncbi:MAG TPA: ATP-binding protein, partial [Cryomorphaceae bacterium]|nr:ATP-binding protein [Cryomorphaceae bacterium]